jgi:hypothetical protein
LIGAERYFHTHVNGVLQHGPMIRAGDLDAFEVPRRRADLVIKLQRAGLRDHDGRHQPHTLGLHVRQDFFVQMVAMFEAIDTEFQRLFRRLIRSVVRGDLDAVAVRDFDQGGHFVIGHGRRRNAAARIRNAAGNRNLDPIRPALDLLSHQMREAIRPVPLEGTMATGGHNDLARCLDARPHHFPAVDGSTQGEIRSMILAHQAQSRNSREQRLPCIAGHAQNFFGVGLRRQRIARRSGQLQTQVHVHIHQAGNQPLARHGNDLGAGGNTGRTRRADRYDTLTVNDDGRVADFLPAVDLDHGATHQGRHCGRGGAPGRTGREAGAGGQNQVHAISEVLEFHGSLSDVSCIS